MKKQYTIYFTLGELSGRRFVVKDEGLVIGGSLDADVRCTAVEILAEHITLLPQNNAAEILLHRHPSAAVSVNGKELTGTGDVLLHKDDKVKIGKSLVFRLELDETAVSPNAAAKVAGKIDEADSDATADESTADEATNGAATDQANSAWVTRYASEEELLDMRGYVNVKKRKKRIQLLVAAIILILLIAGICFYQVLSTEDVLTWPSTKASEDEDCRFTLGRSANFLMFYPKDPKMVVLKDGAKYQPTRKAVVVKDNCTYDVLSVIGRKKDVPFHMTLQINTVKDGFRVTKMKSFENWKRKMQMEHGYVFTENPEIVFYSKSGCGLPGYSITYRRQFNQVSWSGIAMYIRYEDKEIVLTKEVFNYHWARARSLLTGLHCVSFSNAMALNYWEVPEDQQQKPLPYLTEIIQRELSKNDEQASWSEIYNAVCCGLCQAHISKATDDITAFEEALHLLRRQQSVWFTRRCLYFNYCRRYGIKPEMQRIRAESLDRFSSLSDYRFIKVCRDDWSL